MKPARKPSLAFWQDKNLKTLKGKKKIRYIWDYYKLPLAVFAVLLYIVCYTLYGRITYKDTALYAALVNVNAGETLTAALDQGFLDYSGLKASENRLELYTGLYLTDDEQNPYHEYTYASRLKIQATIDGELLDVVLMNKEAFDAFSQSGYLYDLEALLKQKQPGLYRCIQADLVSNIVILEDNSTDVLLDPSIPYKAVTEEHFYGVDLSRTTLIRQAGFEEKVYWGVIANSPRTDAAMAYLQYLFSID